MGKVRQGREEEETTCQRIRRQSRGLKRTTAIDMQVDEANMLRATESMLRWSLEGARVGGDERARLQSKDEFRAQPGEEACVCSHMCESIWKKKNNFYFFLFFPSVFFVFLFFFSKEASSLHT